MSSNRTSSIKRLPDQDKNVYSKSAKNRDPIKDYAKKGADKLEKVRQNNDVGYLLNIPEACETLNIGKSTLSELVRRRDLVAVKIGSRTLFRPKDINQFINNLQEWKGEGSEQS